jgi:hypothetical protein
VSSGDTATVEISLDGGLSWQPISESFDQNSQAWTRLLVDISAFKGQTVKFGLHIVANGYGESWGWYVDDLDIIEGKLQVSFPEGFEGGIGDWYADFGTWEVGAPTIGPGGAFTGELCAATVLNAHYNGLGF